VEIGKRIIPEETKMACIHPEEYEIETGQDWEVDLFHPEDAEGVSRLFESVYGPEYPIKTYLDPDRLIEENAAGRIISSVARTFRGGIVGHNALFQSGPNPFIYESGAGVVHKDYRGGKGIFTRMVSHGQEVGAKAFRVDVLYGEPVCNHVFSQKLCYGLGWTTHAVEADLMPAAAYEQEKSATGRVSSLLDFLTLRPRPHSVYLPEVYEEPLRFIYRSLDDERHLFLSREAIPSRLRTEARTQYFDFAQVARVRVEEAGTDLGSVLGREEEDLKSRSGMVIQVWSKLSWPWIGEVVGELRSRGYFLGGILPQWFDEDGLLMQKVLKRPDWGGISLYTDRAKHLLSLVREDWDRGQTGAVLK
jgi:hypothetical protein